jgi:hypothetical protein
MQGAHGPAIVAIARPWRSAKLLYRRRGLLAFVQLVLVLRLFVFHFSSWILSVIGALQDVSSRLVNRISIEQYYEQCLRPLLVMDLARILT